MEKLTARAGRSESTPVHLPPARPSTAGLLPQPVRVLDKPQADQAQAALAGPLPPPAPFYREVKFATPMHEPSRVMNGGCRVRLLKERPQLPGNFPGVASEPLRLAPPPLKERSSTLCHQNRIVLARREIGSSRWQV